MRNRSSRTNQGRTSVSTYQGRLADVSNKEESKSTSLDPSCNETTAGKRAAQKKKKKGIDIDGLQVEPRPLFLHLCLPLPRQRVLALAARPADALVDPAQLEGAPRL